MITYEEITRSRAADRVRELIGRAQAARADLRLAQRMLREVSVENRLRWHHFIGLAKADLKFAVRSAKKLKSDPMSLIRRPALDDKEGWADLEEWLAAYPAAKSVA